jgi:hypothetical protein
VNLLGDNTGTLKKNTQILTDASRDVGLEINIGKTKYMLLFHHQNAEENNDICWNLVGIPAASLHC